MCGLWSYVISPFGLLHIYNYSCVVSYVKFDVVTMCSNFESTHIFLCLLCVHMCVCVLHLFTYLPLRLTT